jgi:hypothetical protein
VGISAVSKEVPEEKWPVRRYIIIIIIIIIILIIIIKSLILGTALYAPLTVRAE